MKSLLGNGDFAYKLWGVDSRRVLRPELFGKTERGVAASGAVNQAQDARATSESRVHLIMCRETFRERNFGRR